MSLFISEIKVNGTKISTNIKRIHPLIIGRGFISVPGPKDTYTCIGRNVHNFLPEMPNFNGVHEPSITILDIPASKYILNIIVNQFLLIQLSKRMPLNILTPSIGRIVLHRFC